MIDDLTQHKIDDVEAIAALLTRWGWNVNENGASFSIQDFTDQKNRYNVSFPG